MILLSDEEIKKLIHEKWKTRDTLTFEELAKAQLKKVVEWGDEDCPHLSKPAEYFDGQHKRECRDCWQALKKEVK